MQAIGLAAIEVVAVFVLRGFKVHLSEVQGAALHANRVDRSLNEIRLECGLFENSQLGVIGTEEFL
jgi:hypothetical protein